MEQHDKTIDRMNHLWKYKEGDSEKGIVRSDNSIIQGQTADCELLSPDKHEEDSEFAQKTKEEELLLPLDKSEIKNDILID